MSMSVDELLANPAVQLELQQIECRVAYQRIKDAMPPSRSLLDSCYPLHIHLYKEDGRLVYAQLSIANECDRDVGLETRRRVVVLHPLVAYKVHCQNTSNRVRTLFRDVQEREEAQSVPIQVTSNHSFLFQIPKGAEAPFGETNRWADRPTILHLQSATRNFFLPAWLPV